MVVGEEEEHAAFGGGVRRGSRGTGRGGPPGAGARCERGFGAGTAERRAVAVEAELGTWKREPGGTSSGADVSWGGEADRLIDSPGRGRLGAGGARTEAPPRLVEVTHSSHIVVVERGTREREGAARRPFAERPRRFHRRHLHRTSSLSARGEGRAAPPRPSAAPGSARRRPGRRRRVYSYTSAMPRLLMVILIWSTKFTPLRVRHGGEGACGGAPERERTRFVEEASDAAPAGRDR